MLRLSAKKPVLRPRPSVPVAAMAALLVLIPRPARGRRSSAGTSRVPAPLPYPAAPDAAPPPAGLQAFNEEHMRLHARAISGLLGWSLLNVGVGAAGAMRSRSESERGFFLATALLQVAVLTPAALAAVTLARRAPARLSLAKSLERGVRVERELSLTGVSLALVCAGVGVWLRERGLRRASPGMRGAGKAMVQQGTLLLLFDAALVGLSRALEQRLFEMLESAPAPERASMPLPY